jgi:hypothetical protein
MASTILTKIQYNNFEPGEFTGEGQRDFAEIVKLIEAFPWEEQRKNVAIDLTCPSVTLQSAEGKYLKLALYFHQKFILYFFDGNEIQSKKFLKAAEASEDIRYFYQHRSIAGGFRKENMAFKKPNQHFESQDFVSLVDRPAALHYLDNFAWFFLTFWIGIILYYLFEMLPSQGMGEIIIWCLLMCIILPAFGAFNVILCKNYYRFSRGKMLQLSKGSPTFLHGPVDNPKTYQKSDINRIEIKRNTAMRCPWNNYSLYYLHMNNGTVLLINSLLIAHEKIYYKFAGIPITENSTFIPIIDSVEMNGLR